MNVLKTLAWSDSIAIISWFKKEAASKILVLTGFFILFTTIAVFLYFASRAFFMSLTVYKLYGVMLVSYLLHASIVILLWFTIASAAFSTITFINTPTIVSKYLITLPLSPRDITLWLFIRSTAMNLFFLGVILSPIMFSFAIVFLSPISGIFFTQLGFVLFILVLLSGSIGGIAGFFIATHIRSKETIASIVGLIVFLIFSYSIIQFIFPASLFRLYDATDDQFNAIYNSLPLVRIPLLTAILTKTIISGFGTQALFLFVLTAFITSICLFFQSKMLISTLQKIEGGTTGTVRIHSRKPILFRSRIPLAVKNLYAISRSPGELGYALFLLSLTVFFFLFLFKATTVRPLHSDYVNTVLLFTYVWFLFFSIAYLLRLVYPLMSKEGTSLWYIFTQPIKRETILHSHVITGLLLSIPLLSIAAFLWTAYPHASGFRLALITLSFIPVVVLTLEQVFLGAVSPTFSLARDPEKVSTSFMGLITFLVSVTLCVLGGLALERILSGSWSVWYGLTVSTLIGLLLCILLYIAARKSLSNLDFSK